MNKDIKILLNIVRRATEMNLILTEESSFLLDLKIAHEQFQLRLDDFLKADDFILCTM